MQSQSGVESVRKSRIARAVLAVLTSGAFAGAALAQSAPTPPVPVPGAAPVQAVASVAATQVAEAPKWPPFEAITKDMQATPGLFTIYRYNPSDNSKDATRLLVQIPRALMKQDLLLATSISRGPMAGYQWEDYLVRFEMSGRLVLMTVPDSRYITRPDQPVGDAVSRTYNDGFLTAMPIVTVAANGDPVVDMGTSLLTPIVNLPLMMGSTGAPSMLAPRKDLSSFSKIKSFPDNVLIDADIALAGRTGAGTTVGVTYSFRRLPAVGSYAARVADERVGYFTTARKDWSMKHSVRDTTLRFINRWDVKKKDPSLELSPPEKPIVFVIEKTVPLQWRKYVAEGTLEWNKAFEKLGIVGAIVVQQQTDDNEFATVDPEDARYNFIRWTVTDKGLAMGPSRADPRTGQILDADIIFDDSMLRFYVREFETFGPQGLASMVGPEYVQFLANHPQFAPMGTDVAELKAAAKAAGTELLHDSSDTASSADVVPGVPRRIAPARAACNYADGMRQQFAMATMAAAAGKKKLPDRFVGEVIKEVIAHEVGHTIGLRHNFKASSWLSEAEIKKRRDTGDEPLVASVMDYNPLVFFAGDDIEKLRHFMTPTIGPYDYWAVEYGYKNLSKDEPDGKALTSSIAAQNTRRELAFATDEDVLGPSSVDPSSNRFDLSDDPIAWSKSRVALCDELLKDIRKWAVKPGEPNDQLRESFLYVWSTKMRNLMFVSRVVGGQIHNRNRPGDPDAKPALTLVEPKKQREALAVLESTIFKDDFLAADPELYNELVPSGRWLDWAGQDPFKRARVDFPVHDYIGRFQAMSLANICSPQTLQRVYDAELKSKAEDKFTAAELVSRVRTMVWASAKPSTGGKYTDSKPLVNSIRRNLQRQHVQYLLAIAESKPGQLVSADLHSMVCYSLRELSQQIGTDAAGAGDRIDFASRAHLSETKSQIDRVLNAPYIQMSPPPGGLILIGQPTGQQ